MLYTHIFPIVLGMTAGSFFNVLILRIPKGKSILWPSSHCTDCGHKISPWENIPVLSYLFLKGRCSNCKTKISPMYPSVEILTALVLLLIWNHSGFDLSIPWYGNIVPILKITSVMLLIPISIIDLKHYIIPDGFTIPFLLISFLVSFIPGNITPVQSILGILAGGGSLYLMGLIGTFILKKGEALGGGDIKMMAWFGALWGPQIALTGIVFGAFFGSAFGISLMMIKKLSSDHKIPFGPFLGAGVALSAFAGNDIFQAYLSFVDSLF